MLKGELLVAVDPKIVTESPVLIEHCPASELHGKISVVVVVWAFVTVKLIEDDVLGL
jgi:hypothetical protein